MIQEIGIVFEAINRLSFQSELLHSIHNFSSPFFWGFFWGLVVFLGLVVFGVFGCLFFGLCFFFGFFVFLLVFGLFVPLRVGKRNPKALCL